MRQLWLPILLSTLVLCKSTVKISTSLPNLRETKKLSLLSIFSQITDSKMYAHPSQEKNVTVRENRMAHIKSQYEHDKAIRQLIQNATELKTRVVSLEIADLRNDTDTRESIMLKYASFNNRLVDLDKNLSCVAWRNGNNAGKIFRYNISYLMAEGYYNTFIDLHKDVILVPRPVIVPPQTFKDGTDYMNHLNATRCQKPMSPITEIYQLQQKISSNELLLSSYEWTIEHELTSSYDIEQYLYDWIAIREHLNSLYEKERKLLSREVSTFLAPSTTPSTPFIYSNAEIRCIAQKIIGLIPLEKAPLAYRLKVQRNQKVWSDIFRLEMIKTYLTQLVNLKDSDINPMDTDEMSGDFWKWFKYVNDNYHAVSKDINNKFKRFERTHSDAMKLGTEQYIQIGNKITTSTTSTTSTTTTIELPMTTDDVTSSTNDSFVDSDDFSTNTTDTTATPKSSKMTIVLIVLSVALTIVFLVSAAMVSYHFIYKPSLTVDSRTPRTLDGTRIEMEPLQSRRPTISFPLPKLMRGPTELSMSSTGLGTSR